LPRNDWDTTAVPNADELRPKPVGLVLEKEKKKMSLSSKETPVEEGLTGSQVMKTS